MISMLIKEDLVVPRHYAAEGRDRLYILGSRLAQRYLRPSDLLIGIIGAEGSRTSTLIQGVSARLELTNDDRGVNVQSSRIYRFSEDGFCPGHTFDWTRVSSRASTRSTRWPRPSTARWTPREEANGCRALRPDPQAVEL